MPGIRTRSNTPYMSVEQRQYFTKKRDELFKDMGRYMNDKDIMKMPGLGIYTDYRMWRLHDVLPETNQVNPMHLYLLTRHEFIMYTDKILYEAECSHAVGDIDDELYQLILAEVSIRRMYVESEINPASKKMLQALLTRDEIKAVGDRLGESIKNYCTSAWRALRKTSSDETDDMPIR